MLVKKITISLPGQEGVFDIGFHRLIAVKNIEDTPQGPPPTIQLDTAAETSDFLSRTLDSGSRLYDAFFTELSAAVLSAGLQSVAASAGPDRAIRSHICQGLKSASAGAHSYEELSWRLRRLLEVAHASLTSRDAPAESSYPAVAQGAWVYPSGDGVATEACPPLGETSFGTTELYALSAQQHTGALEEDTLLDYPMLPESRASALDSTSAGSPASRRPGIGYTLFLGAFSVIACTLANHLSTIGSSC